MNLLALESNVDEVIEQLRRSRSLVWRGVDEALSPKYWGHRALEVAESTLKAMSETSESDAVDRLLDTFRTRELVNPNGFELELGALRGTEKPFPFADLARESSPLFAGQAREVILRWVKEAKELDERDELATGEQKSPEEIAEGIYWILFSRNRTWDKELATDSLLGSKRESGLPGFAKQVADEASVTKERMVGWLRIVGAAWERMIEEELPGRMRKMINGNLRRT
jgi:hypothetical protein